MPNSLCSPIIRALLATWLIAACERLPTPPVARSTPPADTPPAATPPVQTPPPADPPPPATGSPPIPPNGPFDIFIASPDGRNEMKFGEGEWPEWSPDGRRLAFTRDGMVHIANVDGSGDVIVAAGAVPSWSPDGKRIAFADSTGIVITNLDGSQRQLVIGHHFRTDTYASQDMGVCEPAWSRDGTRIAFVHLGDADIVPPEVWVVDVSGAHAHAVSYEPLSTHYTESDPAWSPDGSRLAYWSISFGIGVVDATTGVARSVFNNFPTVSYGARPAWSPDATILLFNSSPYNDEQPDIYSVPVDGGDAFVIIRNGFNAAWSPSGFSVAFVRPRGPPASVFGRMPASRLAAPSARHAEPP